MFVSMLKLTFQDQRTHQILHKFFKLRKIFAARKFCVVKEMVKSFNDAILELARKLLICFQTNIRRTRA